MLMLILLMVPVGALIVPLWSLVFSLGLINTYFALILPPLANPLGAILMRQFILGLPKDLENAARLDGLNDFQIYWRIILPLIKPGLVVLAVIIFTDQFISFVWPLIATTSDNLHRPDGRRRLASGAWRRRLRLVVGVGGHVAGADRHPLLHPAAPVPGALAGRSAEAMTDRQRQTAAPGPPSS